MQVKKLNGLLNRTNTCNLWDVIVLEEDRNNDFWSVNPLKTPPTVDSVQTADTRLIACLGLCRYKHGVGN
jgi:hypothetical protein